MFRMRVWFEPDVKTFQRIWNRARKAGLRAMGDLYAANYIHKHFTQAGGREYGYKPRQIFRKVKGGKTTSRGSRAPLVDSGDLKRDATGSVKVKVYGARAVIQMDVPWYIRMHEMEDELTRITRAEAEEMAGAYAKAVNRELEKTPRRRHKVE